MKQLTRREMLKMMGVTSVGLALAACAPAAPGAAPAEGGAAASQETVKITMIESWFGVPQFNESIDPVTQAISKKMQDEGLNIEIQSLISGRSQCTSTRRSMPPAPILRWPLMRRGTR